jgi:biopolymer transport protein TolR
MAFDTGGGGKKGKPKPDMNVTPLVDVVLVLLIIFMVVTPMLAKQFWVNVPSEPDEAAAPPPPSEAPPSIVVTVQPDGTIRVNSDVVPLGELSERVTRALAARTDRTVFFDAHSDAEYGIAVEVLDTLRGGGATTVAVMTEPLADTAAN